MRRPEGVAASDWQRGAGRTCSRPVRRPSAALATVSEIAPDFVRLHERAAELAAARASVSPGRASRARCAGSTWARSCGWSSRRWTSRRRCRTSCCKPTRTSEEARRRAWIFTSATLGDDARLSLVHRALRPRRSRGAARRQPVRLRDAGGALRAARLAQAQRSGAQRRRWRRWRPKARAALGGRTHGADDHAARAARHRRASCSAASRRSGEVEVLVQGQWPKRRLMERFREGAAEGRPGCVLVASASFWEGVDVPGDALQLVVIDKLPFPPPSDPLVEARAQRLESQGRSAFNDYFVARGRGGAQAGRRPLDPARDRTRACWWSATRAWRRWATAGACWPRCRRCATTGESKDGVRCETLELAWRSALPDTSTTDRCLVLKPCVRYSLCG